MSEKTPNGTTHQKVMPGEGITGRVADSAAAPRVDAELVGRLRDDLRAANWTTDTVNVLLSPRAQEAMSRDQLTPARQELSSQSGAAALLTRLFILAETLPAPQISMALPHLGIEGAVSLGLVTTAEIDGAPWLRAQVDLRPHSASFEAREHDWWIASDLSQAQTGLPPSEDHVLGIASATTNLLRQTLRDPVGAALDLGCGCGVLALYLTTHAAKVVATDISRRACDFTSFNALLNEAAIDVRCGSLFEPVARQTFDLITSNPPFVITPDAVRDRVNLDYRDGGLPRDTLVSLVLRDGVMHLNDGGVLQMLANWEVGADESTWDTRPAQWVRDASASIVESGGQVDAWVVQRDLVDIAQYAEWWMRDQWGEGADRATWEREYREWLDDFTLAGTRYVGLGSISVRVTWDSAGGEHGGTADRGRSAPAGNVNLVAEFLPEGPAANGDAVRIALDSLVLPAGWRDATFLRSPDVREVRYYVPGTPDPEMIRLTQGAAGGRDRAVSSAVAAFVGVCDGDLTARQVVPAIASLMGISDGEVWQQLEDALPELVRSGALRADSPPCGEK